jgi:hypothetical protein
MKKLELNQMENLEGGRRNPVITSIGVGCAAIGLASVAAGIFTFGAGTVFGLALGGAFCTGAGIGSLAWELNH